MFYGGDDVKLLLIFTLCIFFQSGFSEDLQEEKGIILDPLLRSLLKKNNIHLLLTPPNRSNRSQFELGKKLFSDPILSGNKRISCQTCHNPEKGTSDGLPMSRTENGKGILRRNAQSLFNIGLNNKPFMFLDGRVHFNFTTKKFTTPDESLNGNTPKADYITSAMNSALAAQALFPLVTDTEMMGKKGENEIADSKDNLEAWERIVDRLKNNETFRDLLVQAYPHISIDQINIGHVVEAISIFEREEFQSIGSPFHRYLKGNDSAMSSQQKRGLLVFLGRGRCVSCHRGNELGNNSLFASSSAPQWGKVPFVDDKGRGEIIHNPATNYFFKVPSLINIGLTAPYMHNGAFQTLNEVIDHYNHISSSLNRFEVSEQRQSKIPVEVKVEKNQNFLDEIWLSSQGANNPQLKNRLYLTKCEKDDLKVFLQEALTDPKWVKK